MDDATDTTTPAPSIDGRDLIAAGVPEGPAVGAALGVARGLLGQLDRGVVLERITAAVEAPADVADDDPLAPLAHVLLAAELAAQEREARQWHERDEPAPWRSWCAQLDENADAQMRNAMRLPSALRGALMPDAHLGYGLPIGGVLATEGTVIPYAVGVDIACRMKLTVLDLDPRALDAEPQRLEKALLERTHFGKGSGWQGRDRADHEVLEDERWRVDPHVAGLRDRAWTQLGTSGSGNHFVEFGTLTLDAPDLGLEPGTYLALLSHSGSRGPGAMIANHFSKLARELHPELPDELRHLAWLDLDGDAGRTYWDAMELMGDFAAANHAIIHERIARHLKARVLAGVENHHNFAWKEQHDGREVVVHRKGATPAGEGVLGVIPGSMAAPGFVVRGRGSAASMHSAAHGAGRVMSRTEAKHTFRWAHVKGDLTQARVKVLAAGIDENPRVYKDIHEVMAAQSDLVDVVARFDPRIVRMADGGEPPED